jgi:hypothetical protein
MFVALAKLVTGGQEIASKIHQHFIPSLIVWDYKNNLTIIPKFGNFGEKLMNYE